MSPSLPVLLDVELPGGLGGLQHELVQLSDLVALEVSQLVLLEGGPELHGAELPPRRLQDLSLQRLPVALQDATHRGVKTDRLHHFRSGVRGLIYKGIYAQKMAYASFYAMFAIYKILT